MLSSVLFPGSTFSFRVSSRVSQFPMILTEFLFLIFLTRFIFPVYLCASNFPQCSFKLPLCYSSVFLLLSFFLFRLQELSKLYKKELFMSRIRIQLVTGRIKDLEPHQNEMDPFFLLSYPHVLPNILLNISPSTAQLSTLI